MNVKLSEAQRKTAVSNPESIAAIMQQILKRENRIGRSQEHFWVVGLNNANKILFIELIALGRQNRVSTNPPDVFRMAIYKLAIKLILVHNHPSGDLTPSGADRAFTDRILKVGEIINVDVLDHLIISETEHVSFAAEGIIAALKNSDTWRLLEGAQLEARKLKQQLELEAVERNAKLEIAKKLKATGMENAAIKKVTGLNIEDIRNL